MNFYYYNGRCDDNIVKKLTIYPSYTTITPSDDDFVLSQDVHEKISHRVKDINMDVQIDVGLIKNLDERKCFLNKLLSNMSSVSQRVLIKDRPGMKNTIQELIRLHSTYNVSCCRYVGDVISPKTICQSMTKLFRHQTSSQTAYKKVHVVPYKTIKNIKGLWLYHSFLKQDVSRENRDTQYARCVVHTILDEKSPKHLTRLAISMMKFLDKTHKAKQENIHDVLLCLHPYEYGDVQESFFLTKYNIFVKERTSSTELVATFGIYTENDHLYHTIKNIADDYDVAFERITTPIEQQSNVGQNDCVMYINMDVIDELKLKMLYVVFFSVIEKLSHKKKK